MQSRIADGRGKALLALVNPAAHCLGHANLVGPLATSGAEHSLRLLLVVYR
jgi:hypothetical protein